MKRLLTFCSVVVATLLICKGQDFKPVKTAIRLPIQVIADPHATTNELIYALLALHNSGITNESPQFWSTIANNTNYSHDHRTRAVLQLLSRHFKPGMTFHDVAVLLDHPTWLDERGHGFFSSGSPPAGGEEDDQWAYAIIFFDDTKGATVWFRFKEKLTSGPHNLFGCLEGRDLDDQLARIKIVGIVSEEWLPHQNRLHNSFGIPGGYPGSFIH